MQTKAIKIFFTVFALVWMVVIFSEYWRYNPDYGKALQIFQYYDLLILFVGLGVVITWVLKRSKKQAFKYLNGMSIFCGLLFLDILAINRICDKITGLNCNAAGVITHCGHVIGVVLCIFLVYLLVRVIGEVFTTILPINISNTDLPVIQVALGIMVFTCFLFTLGVVGGLNAFVLFPFCLLVLGVYWKLTLQIIKKTLFRPFKIPQGLNAVGIFSFLFLAIFLVFNFAQVLRPFPIGSDSLRLYVNLPVLIAEYGGLVSGHTPYNWSLFMSTGLTIFGRIDVVLGLSFLGGFLALSALFQLSRKWLDVNYSAGVLLLFYSLPMTNFLSYMDMKVDMGFLFISFSILLLYYNWMVPIKREKKKSIKKGVGLLKTKDFFKRYIPKVLKQNNLLVLIGLLTGFAFGIKLTVLFLLLALNSAIWFFKEGKLGFLASFFLSFGAVFLLQLDAQPDLRYLHQNVYVLQWGLILLGMGILVYMLIKKKNKLLELVTYSLIIGSFFVLPILPWIGKNFIETQQVSTTSLLNGRKATPTIELERITNQSKKDEVIIPGLYRMPDVPEQTVKNGTEGGRKSVSEDLHRFMGYETVPVRYLTLPYDVFIKTNISSFFTDVGFIMILLLPILFLFPICDRFEWKLFSAKVGFIFLSILLLIISIPSAFLNHNNLFTTADGLSLLASNPSSGLLGKWSDWTNSLLLDIYGPLNKWLTTSVPSKDSITYPFLILLFLLILSLVYLRIKKHNKVTQSIIFFLSVYFFLWWILGSGAPWYGLLVFSLPFIFFFKSISTPKGEGSQLAGKLNLTGTIKRNVFLSIGVVWVFLALVLRSANYTPADNRIAQHLYYPSILDYTMGNRHENELMDYHFPYIRQWAEIINEDKESLVYMVGSPFSYFIHRNDRRVFSDTYLDFFNRLVVQHETKENIIAALKSEGFRYIIFDLNMASYDVTPGKTLTRKFSQFLNTLYNNQEIEMFATNRKIKLNATGEEIFAVFQDKGSIVQNGNMAIFRIK